MIAYCGWGSSYIEEDGPTQQLRRFQCRHGLGCVLLVCQLDVRVALGSLSMEVARDAHLNWHRPRRCEVLAEKLLVGRVPVRTCMAPSHIHATARSQADTTACFAAAAAAMRVDVRDVTSK